MGDFNFKGMKKFTDDSSEDLLTGGAAYPENQSDDFGTGDDVFDDSSFDDYLPSNTDEDPLFGSSMGAKSDDDDEEDVGLITDDGDMFSDAFDDSDEDDGTDSPILDSITSALNSRSDDGDVLGLNSMHDDDNAGLLDLTAPVPEDTISASSDFDEEFEEPEPLPERPVTRPHSRHPENRERRVAENRVMPTRSAEPVAEVAKPAPTAETRSNPREIPVRSQEKTFQNPISAVRRAMEEKRFSGRTLGTPPEQKNEPVLEERKIPAPEERPQVKPIEQKTESVPLSVANKAPLSHFTVHVDNGDVHVSGHGRGIVFVGDGNLVVDNDGFLEECSVHCSTADIYGRVSGNVAGRELARITIQNGAKVTGDICADSVIVKSGIVVGNLYGSTVSVENGAVKGNIIGKEELAVTSGSRIKGDVESGHLNIDKDAMISGSCKQYSSGVTIPDDIFEG